MYFQPYADAQRGVHFPHLILPHAAHVLVQPRLVQRPELLQQDSGIPEQTAGRALEPHMGGLAFPLHIPGDGGGNDGGTVVVSNVVLNDQHRTDAALLRAGGWRKVSVIDIAQLNGTGPLISIVDLLLCD